MNIVNKHKILIIDDEADIRRFLRTALEQSGFAVIESENARNGIKTIRQETPSIVLLDLGLPDIDGIELIDKIREFTDIPIIILSARGQESDKIKSLEIGADDYLTKPFSTAELIARIKVAIRHLTKGEKLEIIEIGEIKLDLVASQAFLGGIELKLTPTELKLLTILMQNAGKLLTHQQLLNAIWDRYTPENNNYLRIHTQHLRKKLQDNPINPKYIITETGVGYRFRNI
jgi:two-component system KDP operon response regulator KdpE